MLYRRDFTREKLNHSQTPLLCRILGGDRGRVEVYYWVRLLGMLVVVTRIELGASKAMGDFAWTLKIRGIVYRTGVTDSRILAQLLLSKMKAVKLYVC